MLFYQQLTLLPSSEQQICPEGMMSLLIVNWLGLLLCLQAPVLTQVYIYQWILWLETFIEDLWSFKEHGT